MPWPSTRLQQLLGIDLPLIQAPMAGAQLSAMAIAVSQAGGLGSLPCAMLTPDKAREHLASKYRFAGSRIDSAEAFIEHLATRSSMSGEPYHVKCGTADLLSGAWLAEELSHYRRVAHEQAAR